ncbi:hypothetical protein SDC9_158023 [bioreactor metagenome]|uniref:Uncharacterized protein n=1 Tax=bioreactor metagenome TaxID=1076179 RepID=A0A645FAU2_9ZZZZ
MAGDQIRGPYPDQIDQVGRIPLDPPEPAGQPGLGRPALQGGQGIGARVDDGHVVARAGEGHAHASGTTTEVDDPDLLRRPIPLPDLCLLEDHPQGEGAPEGPTLLVDCEGGGCRSRLVGSGHGESFVGRWRTAAVWRALRAYPVVPLPSRAPRAGVPRLARRPAHARCGQRPDGPTPNEPCPDRSPTPTRAQAHRTIVREGRSLDGVSDTRRERADDRPPALHERCPTRTSGYDRTHASR